YLVEHIRRTAVNTPQISKTVTTYPPACKTYPHHSTIPFRDEHPRYSSEHMASSLFPSVAATYKSPPHNHYSGNQPPLGQTSLKITQAEASATPPYTSNPISSQNSPAYAHPKHLDKTFYESIHSL